MKKITAVIASVMMCITIGTTMVTAATTDSFDYNEDGTINIVDVIILKSAILEGETLRGEVVTAKDFVEFQSFFVEAPEKLSGNYDFTDMVVSEENDEYLTNFFDNLFENINDFEQGYDSKVVWFKNDCCEIKIAATKMSDSSYEVVYEYDDTFGIKYKLYKKDSKYLMRVIMY